jgi:hypothetical protein
MKQPTAEDVMAACEVERLYRQAIEDCEPDEEDGLRAAIYRASRVMVLWLDQFDEDGG